MALLDQWGMPIDLSALREEQAAPDITGVRQVISGHPAQGLTPERLATLLRESEDGSPERYLELAEEMEEKDLHYLAQMNTRKRFVAQLDITVEAASDSADDKANADLVRDWLARDTLEEDLFDILDAIGKGFSVTEIIWEMSERQWSPARLEWRDPRWFEFDRKDGRTILLRGNGPSTPLAPFKFIRHTHKAKSGIPIRGGLARPVAWYYLFKNYDIKDWVAFVDRYGLPLRVGKYGPGATAEEKRKLLRAVAQLGSDAGAIIPASMLIEIIEAKAGGVAPDVFAGLANYCDQQISKAVLGQTTTADAISGGHAVSQEHNEVRLDIGASDGRQLAATLNRDVARPLIDLNRGPQKVYPRIQIEVREKEDVTALVTNVEKLVKLGARVEASVMTDKLGLPDPKPGTPPELLLRAPAPPAADPGTEDDQQDKPGGKPPVARQSQQAARPDAIDRLADDVLGDWEPLMQPLLDGLEAVLDGAGSMEAARDRLAEALGRMDDAAFAELLAKAGFASRIAGELDAPVREDGDGA